MKLNLARKAYRQRGMTLIEATMVLALSAVVIAGVMLYFQSAQANNRLQSAMGELGGVQTAVQTIYASQSDYAALTTDKIANSASIPPVYRETDATGTAALTNPWKGAVTVVATTGNDAYTVEFTGVPKEACVAMGSMNLGGSQKSVAINGAAALQPEVLTPDKVNTDCLKADPATLVWTFQ